MSEPRTSAPAERLPLKRRMMFALVAILIAIVATAGALLGIDVYLHGKYQKSAGFNVWGYRGPSLGRRQPGEYRVVVLGGSSAYGYGVDWAEAIPAQLEQRLAAANSGRTHRVANLAYNNEGAYSFRFTLEDYRGLNYDLAILYEGYNDLMGDPRGPNLAIFRRDSPVFRLTGYLPIFPIVFKEKAAAMRGGNVSELYRLEGKTTFHANLATRTVADVITATAEISQSLEAQLGKVATQPERRIVDVANTGCKYPWQEYCKSISDAVSYAVGQGKQVIVATQPYEFGPVLRARHMEQQGEMRAMLERKFGNNARVRYVNMGDVVDLGDPLLSFDRMHLTAKGNAVVAQAFVAPVIDMAALQQGTRH